MRTDPRWPTWTDSLACCAFLRDPAREQTFGRAVTLREALLRQQHLDALRTMTDICRRFLCYVEEDTHAGRT